MSFFSGHSSALFTEYVCEWYESHVLEVADVFTDDNDEAQADFNESDVDESDREKRTGEEATKNPHWSTHFGCIIL